MAGDPDITYDYYYSGYQVVEVRKDGDADPYEQYVWGLRYIHSPVCRWRDADTDGASIQTLYYTNDANFNVTALVETDGDVAERYTYDPYGKRTIYDDDWSDEVAWANSEKNEVLFTGHRLDPETGLYHTLYRYYHPALGRWLQRDPIGYADGLNFYEYVASSPPGYVDWDGTITGLPSNFSSRGKKGQENPTDEADHPVGTKSAQQREQEWRDYARQNLPGLNNLNSRTQYVINAMDKCLLYKLRERLEQLKSRMEVLTCDISTFRAISRSTQCPEAAIMARGATNEMAQLREERSSLEALEKNNMIKKHYGPGARFGQRPDKSGAGWQRVGGGEIPNGTQWREGENYLGLEASSGDAAWSRTARKFTPPQKCLDQLGLNAGDPQLERGLLGLAMTLAWELNHWAGGRFEDRPTKMSFKPEAEFWNSVDCCCLRIHFGMPE